MKFNNNYILFIFYILLMNVFICCNNKKHECNTLNISNILNKINLSNNMINYNVVVCPPYNAIDKNGHNVSVFPYGVNITDTNLSNLFSNLSNEEYYCLKEKLSDTNYDWSLNLLFKKQFDISSQELYPYDITEIRNWRMSNNEKEWDYRKINIVFDTVRGELKNYNNPNWN